MSNLSKEEIEFITKCLREGMHLPDSYRYIIPFETKILGPEKSLRINCRSFALSAARKMKSGQNLILTYMILLGRLKNIF